MEDEIGQYPSHRQCLAAKYSKQYPRQSAPIFWLLYIIQMLVDRQYILDNLRELQSSNYRQAENNIHQKIKTMPGAIEHLIEIMQSDQQESIRMSAATFLNTAIISEVSDTHNCKRVCRLILGVLANPKISDRCKGSLQRAITSLIQETSQQKTHDWLNLSMQLMKDQMANPSTYLIMQGYAMVEIQQSCFLLYVNTVMPASIDYMLKPHRTLSDLKQWATAFSQLLDRLSDLIEKKVNSVSRCIIDDLCEMQTLVEVIEKVYLVQVNERVLLVADSEVNALKYEACALHQKLVEFMYFSKKPMERKHVELLERMLPYYTQTLLAVSENCEEKLAHDSQAKEFVVEIMRIYKRCVKMIDFLPIFQQQAKKIIITILIPMLKMGKVQQELFDGDSQEWCSHADDIVDRQTSLTLKTQATSVLQAFIDSIDGTATFLFDLSLNSLLFNMSAQQPQPQQPPTLVLDNNTSFIILTSMSFIYTNHRRDLLHRLRTFFTQHFSILSQLSTPMQLAWCYIFFSFNYIDLFPCPSEGEPYIAHASQYTGHPTTVQTAVDFISNVTEEYYTDELFKVMVDRALDCEALVLWDVYLMYAIKVAKQISEEGMTYMVASLYKRMDIDLAKLEKSKYGEGLIYIIKSLTVIHGICKNTTYIADKPVLQAKIWQVFALFQHSKRMQFQQDVLTILVLLLANPTLTQTSQRQLLLLPLLQSIITSNHPQIIDIIMFSVLNFYINKTQPLQQPATRKLLQLLMLNLSDDERHQDLTSATLLLLQIFVKKFEVVLCRVEVEGLMNKLAQLDMRTGIGQQRIMNLRVIMYPLQLRHGIVGENTFIHQLLQEEDVYQTQYQRKVLVMGLCWALFEEKDFLSIGEMINIMTRQLSNYLHSSSVQKAKPKKITLATIIQRLRTQWKKIDIFVYFRQQMSVMQSSNQILYNQLLTSLTNEVRQQLQSLANVVTIHSTPRKIFKGIVAREVPNFECEYDHSKHEHEDLSEIPRDEQEIEEEEDTGRELPKNKTKKVKM